MGKGNSDEYQEQCVGSSAATYSSQIGLLHWKGKQNSLKPHVYLVL